MENNHTIKMNGTNNLSRKNSSIDDPDHDMGPKMPCPTNEAEALKEW